MAPPPDLIGDRAFSSPPIYVSDLDRCIPSAALSTESRRGVWRTLPYETPAFSGTMLMANPETGAPDIICRLDLRGPHAISIGIHPSDIGQIDWHNATGDVVWLRARLTGDQSFSVLEWDPGGHLKRRRLEEIFWKVADLTDQEITFSQYGLRAGTGAHPELGDHAPARIAYIKLVPLTERGGGAGARRPRRPVATSGCRATPTSATCCAPARSTRSGRSSNRTGTATSTGSTGSSAPAT